MTTVVFIVGTGHCGSTLVDLILGSHHRCFSLGQFSRLPEMLDRGGRICSICPGACPVWDRPRVRRTLESHFSWLTGSRPARSLFWRLGWLRPPIYSKIHRWTGRPVIVDSSKSLPWIGRQLKSCRWSRSARSVVLYVHRDGRAVVNSNIRKYPNRGVEAIAKDWAQQTEEVERFLATEPGDQNLHLSYEGLCLNTAEEAARLCREIGIAYEPGMLEYWSGDHHLVSGNAGTYSLIFQHRRTAATLGERDVYDESFYDSMGLSIRLDLRWQRELSPEDLSAFERVAGATNRPYAFELDDASPAAAPRPLAP